MSDLNQEAKQVLQNYLDGDLSNDMLEEWLAQVEYDSDVSQELRDALAPLRLAIAEAQEGVRPNDDVVAKVAALLAASAPERLVITPRAGSSTSWQSPGEPLTAAPSQVQRVGISAGTGS